MIDYTRQAAGHVVALLDDYDAKDRPEAMRNLQRALREAWAGIEANPAGGLLAPGPYPHLAHRGVLWVHIGPYWVAWRRSPRLTISAVFFDEADIPGRYAGAATSAR